MKVSQGTLTRLKAQIVSYMLRYARGRRYSEKEGTVGKDKWQIMWKQVPELTKHKKFSVQGFWVRMHVW